MDKTTVLSSRKMLINIYVDFYISYLLKLFLRYSQLKMLSG